MPATKLTQCFRLHQFSAEFKKILLVALLATVLSGFPASAWGCPACVGSGSDVYVRAHIVIEDGTMKRLDVHWDLSETLAQALVKNHDRDRDGRLDSTERLVLNKAFVGCSPGNWRWIFSPGTNRRCLAMVDS